MQVKKTSEDRQQGMAFKETGLAGGSARKGPIIRLGGKGGKKRSDADLGETREGSKDRRKGKRGGENHFFLERACQLQFFGGKEMMGGL